MQLAKFRKEVYNNAMALYFILRLRRIGLFCIASYILPLEFFFLLCYNSTVKKNAQKQGGTNYGTFYVTP